MHGLRNLQGAGFLSPFYISAVKQTSCEKSYDAWRYLLLGAGGKGNKGGWLAQRCICVIRGPEYCSLLLQLLTHLVCGVSLHANGETYACWPLLGLQDHGLYSCQLLCGTWCQQITQRDSAQQAAAWMHV